MVDGFSFDSSLLYIGQGGAQQPPKPSLTPKEGHGTNLGVLWVKIVTSGAFPVDLGAVWAHGTTAYAGLRSYRASSKLLDFRVRARSVLSVWAAIRPYELGLSCSLARWNRMDESYNTMVLDFHFEKLEKSLFSNPSYG